MSFHHVGGNPPLNFFAALRAGAGSLRGRIHRKIPFWAISSGESCAKRDFRRKLRTACRLGKRLVPDFCKIFENRNFLWINRRKTHLKV